MDETVETHFKCGQDFEDLLTEANDAATKNNDVEFIERMQQNWKQYGMRTYLSTAQLKWLQRIAEQG